MGKSWKSFEVHARKSLQTIKGDSGESSERKRESYTEILNLFREYLSHPEQNVSRNMDSNSHSDESSSGNEEHVTGNWRKGHPYYKVAKTWLNCVLVLIFCGRRNF